MPGAKICIVNHPYEADRKVFIVEQSYQEQNQQLIAGGKLVRNGYEADIKVCLVNHDYDAEQRRV